MNGGQLPTNQLHDINWGTLDHVSRAHIMSCNYYIMYTHAYAHMRAHTHTHTHYVYNCINM